MKKCKECDLNEAIQQLERLLEGELDPYDTHFEADKIVMEFMMKYSPIKLALKWEEVKDRLGFWYSSN